MSTTIKYTKEVLEEAVRLSTSVAEVSRRLGCRTTRGGICSYLRKRLNFFNIDTSHFTGRYWARGTKRPKAFNRRSANDILVCTPGKRIRTEILRRSLLEIGVAYVCKQCGQLPLWQGAPLTLEIDHVDGDCGNNSPENLRFICLHCHSQTDTFRSKNRKPQPPIERPQVPPKSRAPRSTKALWPSREELARLLETTPARTLAAQLGVSGTAVRKHLLRLGLEPKHRGFWSSK